MGAETLIIIAVLAIGFYMSWNIGANDVSNAMGTSVGSGALTLRRAVIVAAILEFSGAFLLGSNVSETLQSGIVNTSHFALEPNTLIIGMISALLATSLWLQAASYFGWPVSTTHAIVGAILGFGLLVAGVHVVHWEVIGSIALSWVLSPGLSALIAFLLFSFLQKKIFFAMHPIHATKRLAPYLVFMSFFAFLIAMGIDGLSRFNVKFEFPFLFLSAFFIAAVCGFIAHIFIKRTHISTSAPTTGTIRGVMQITSLQKALKHLNRVRITSSGDTRTSVNSSIGELEVLVEGIRDRTKAKPNTTSDYLVVERIFGFLQIITACFVAFAHGANDVANAIGPVASVISIIRDPSMIGHATPIPLWLLALGGIGIVIGLATWGWRVIETIGKKITELTPSRGFCAEFGASMTILIASKLGLPISTTHCIVGAVLGVGLAKGISALNLRMIRDIVLSWVITIPSSAITCMLIYYLLRLVF